MDRPPLRHEFPSENSSHAAGLFEDRAAPYELRDWLAGAFVGAILLAAALIQRAQGAFLPFAG